MEAICGFRMEFSFLEYTGESPKKRKAPARGRNQAVPEKIRQMTLDCKISGPVVFWNSNHQTYQKIRDEVRRLGAWGDGRKQQEKQKKERMYHVKIYHR